MTAGTIAVFVFVENAHQRASYTERIIPKREQARCLNLPLIDIASEF